MFWTPHSTPVWPRSKPRLPNSQSATERVELFEVHHRLPNKALQQTRRLFRAVALRGSFGATPLRRGLTSAARAAQLSADTLGRTVSGGARDDLRKLSPSHSHRQQRSNQEVE